MIDELTAGELPRTYPRTFVLKSTSQQAGGTLGAAFASNQRLIDVVDPGGGLALLTRLERRGDITGAFPVGVNSTGATSGLPSGAGALSVLAAQTLDDAPASATIVKVAATVDLDDLLVQLTADPQVAFAEKVPVRYASAALPALGRVDRYAGIEERLAALEGGTTIPPAAGAWNLRRIGLPDVEAAGLDRGRQVRVGVLDTGIDVDHPALGGEVATYAFGDPNVFSALDVVGHGTHVAGTINSHVNPALGCRGVCGSRIRAWKIFDDEPDFIRSGSVYWYLVDPVLYRQSLADCVGKVDVLNLSIGGGQPPDPQERELYALLLREGVSVVAAMGNERAHGSPVSYPAAIPGVVAVGALSASDDVAAFSNAGDHIALSAPGVGIWSTVPHYPGQAGFRAVRDGAGQPSPGVPFPRPVNYASFDGTSMASPHVAAAAALLIANSSVDRSPQEIRDLLMVTAARVPAMAGRRWTRDLGTGCLDLRRLIFAARRL